MKKINFFSAIFLVAVFSAAATLSASALDTTDLAVSITDPVEGSNLSGVVNITADATDSVPIVGVQLFVDGTLLSTDTTAPYTTSWNTDAASLGTHTLTAKAFDGSGNTSGNVVTSSPVNVNVVDNAAPTVSITSPVNGAQVSRNSTTIINASATDNRGVSKVEFYVNNVLKCTDTTAAYSCAWTVPSQKNVNYALMAKAYDTSGNITSTTISVTSK
jgi:hypothetical protein